MRFASNLFNASIKHGRELIHLRCNFVPTAGVVTFQFGARERRPVDELENAADFD